MKKGISLIVLVITIIVMIIITGVVVISGSSSLVETTKAQLETDIAQLESLMKIYARRTSNNLGFESVEFDTTTLTAAEKSQFEGETITDNKITLYVIDLAAIDAEAVNYGNLNDGQNDRYLYSITTGKVYYEKGLNVDNVNYYHI